MFARLLEDLAMECLEDVTVRDLTSTAMASKEECIALHTSTPTFFDMAGALNAAHNTYEIHGEQADFFEVRKLDAFRLCLLRCREDVFDFLVDQGWDRHQAKKAMEYVWKGKAVHWLEKLEKLQLPEELKEAAKHCLYLFPRGSGAQRLVLLMQLAWYLKQNRTAYFAELSGS